MSSIFKKGEFLDPKYQFLDKYVDIMYKGLWTPSKYQQLFKQVDVPHIKNILSDIDKNVVKKCILATAMVEDKVKTFWTNIVNDFPHTVIGDISGLFGQSEVTHRRSYHSLVTQLNIDTSSVDTIPVLRDRIKYLQKYLEKDSKIIGKKRILKKLVLFTSLVERCSLFTQFYILMTFAYRGKGLKTISALQESTAIEENVHYSFGIDLINIIKQEEPQLWDDYLIELVEKNIKMAYQSELKLIDWFFEDGVPSHIKKEEVINFLNYNFNRVCDHLDLGLTFNYDENILENVNKFFIIKTKTKVDPDFFDNAVGGYSSVDTEINLEEFKI